MEIKIAIIENHTENIKHLFYLLEEWMVKNNIQLEMKNFYSEKLFLSECDTNYDIMFLNILCDSAQSFMFANKCRKKHYVDEVVLVSDSAEKFVHCWNVHPLTMLLKPIVFSDINLCLHYISNKLMKHSFIYRHYNSSIKIPYQQIIYFGISNQNMTIVTITGSYTMRKSIKSILGLLPSHFVQCHRAYVVNALCVIKLLGNELELCNKMFIPVGRLYYPKIKDVFFRGGSIN